MEFRREAPVSGMVKEFSPLWNQGNQYVPLRTPSLSFLLWESASHSSFLE
jgi:hypothetical protein